MYVDIKERDKWLEFVYFLERHGYKETEFTRRNILESVLPFNINIARKTYSRMGNVTCACGASSGGVLMTQKEAMSILDKKGDNNE